MDTGSRGELLAANMTVDEIREYLDVDTLSYLGLDRLIAATGATNAGFCDACLSGNYPVAVPDRDTKHMLEHEPASPESTVPVQLLVESDLPVDEARSGGVDGG
jgi:amidophosphoribosyltransferase